MARKTRNEPPAPPPLPPLDPAQRYTLEEAARYLRISETTLFRDMQAGVINTIKDRSRRFVPGSEIIRRSSLSAADQNDSAP